MVLRVTGGMFARAGVVGPGADDDRHGGSPIRSGRRRRGEAWDAGAVPRQQAGDSAEPDMADGVRKPGPPDWPKGSAAMTGKGLSRRT